MANDVLDGDRIAILVTDGFEQVELLQPRKALDEAADEKPQILSWASLRHATDAFGYA